MIPFATPMMMVPVAGGESPAGHRYWGISISANNSADGVSGGFGFAELRFFDATGACISDGLTGYANAGWTPDSGKAAADGASDGLTSTLEVVAYQGGVLPFIVWFDFGSPVDPALMQVVGYTEAFNAACPRDYAMVYSDDAATWTSVASTTGQTNWQENEDRTLENPGNVPSWIGQNAFSSTKWRIRLEDYYSAYFAWAWSELETYATIGGSKLTVSSIASNYSWSPGLSNFLDGNDQTYAAFADNPPRRKEVYVELTYSSAVSLSEIGLRARNTTGDPADIGRQMPNELRVEYLDGSTWKYAGYLIDPNASYAAKGALRRFPLLIAN